MPNRILKDSICTSDSINELTWFEECLFYRLIVNCDDYGRFDGRVAIIRSRLFPLKTNVTDKAISDALNKLASKELVILYTYENKPYLYLPSWGKHQRLRNSIEKYPSPEDSDILPQVAASCRELPPESESKKESESEYESNAHARDLFREWYEKYPRKIDPTKARKAWDKLKVDEPLFEKIMLGLDKWIASWDDPQFIPHPTTWLNNRRWEAEPPKQKKQNAALWYEQTAISEDDFNALVVNLEEEEA